jgi:hypothetical protein
MALVLKDRVKETTTTTGTGTLTLLGASTGYQSFSAIGNGNTCYYAISTTGGNQWEVGIGTYTASGTLLSRDTILESSTGGGAIDLDAGTKDVYVVYPAEKGVWLDASGNLVQNQFTSMNVTGTATINVATLTSGTISTAANAATDIVNKAYVDNAVAAGTHFHEPVRVESPINLNATYNNGTDGVGATLTNAGTQAALVIDGITMVVADRVLVYEQTNQTQNGVYVVTSIGSGATNWVLTRSDDANTYVTDSPDGLSEGSTFFVQEGATGAGETYTCNTVGVITFGTTNITFAQVSSAQIYSAGTGLNLSGTTFSIANTTVTPATYGSSGQVAQIAINAQGQITSASNVGIAITASNVSGLAASATTDTTNASNITTGTLANARTTASANNGASTIVARDASGNFAAAGITATTFSGSGASLTSLNGTAISSGTVANARTTASSSNGASTIVARDASGNFSANVITATTFSGAVTGDGSALTNLNASAVTTGTLANARTSASSTNGASTIVARDASGNFTTNTITATLTGTASNATVLQNARTIALQDGATGTATSFNGSANISIPVTALNASVLSAGTVPSARISGGYTGITQVGTLTAGVWNATAITDTYLATISTAGKVSNSATTATNSNGANSIVARDASGNFSAGTITANLTGTASTATTANALNTSNSYTGANFTATAAVYSSGTGGFYSSTFVINSRNPIWRFANADAYGMSYFQASAGIGGSDTIGFHFGTASAAGSPFQFIANGNLNVSSTVTASTFSGSGASLTSLNASNISAGTVATARLASGTANSTTFLRGDSTWAAVSVTAAAVSDQNNTSTGYFDLPVGTTAQRPGSPTVGMVRYNSTENEYEVYKGTSWQLISTVGYSYSVEYLIVAGGGGGAGLGGGGAGGMVSGSTTVTGATAYTITVGGGASGAVGNAPSGSASSGLSVSATGGGGGGGETNGGASPGGSGGGASAVGAGTYSGAAGTPGQGNSGGSATSFPGQGNCGGGGGGKNASGGNAQNSPVARGGNGGNGLAWSDGVTYAGGGGGGAAIGGGQASTGGSGGGGAGRATPGTGTSGTAGLGGGGGGCNSGSTGGAGGSGTVIIRYSGSQRGTGGTVTSAGGFTYHTFTTSGTYTA